MSVAVAIFWISATALLYNPLGYLMCLGVISLITRRPVKRAPIRPAVSVIIPVHNGAALIKSKIENTRTLHYPSELLEIVVVDDCSTDGTAEQAHGAALIPLHYRQGKAAALNAGLAVASGDIIGFTDLGAMLEADALVTAVECFADQNVGCVSSEDYVVSEGGVGEGEGKYTRIDTQIRRLEGRIGSIAGVSGSFYLVRRELCPPFPLDVATDMFSGLCCVDRGFRAVVEERSKVRICAQKDAGMEFERKVRTMVTGLRALRAFRHLLNPLRSGAFAWFLASHKLMRYLMPVFAISALYSSAYLAPWSAFYRFCFIVGITVLGIGLGQILMQSSTITRRIPGAPAFVCASLVAAAAGWYRFFAGERYETWQPTKRSAV